MSTDQTRLTMMAFEQGQARICKQSRTWSPRAHNIVVPASHEAGEAAAACADIREMRQATKHVCEQANPARPEQLQLLKGPQAQHTCNAHVRESVPLNPEESAVALPILAQAQHGCPACVRAGLAGRTASAGSQDLILC